MSQLLEQIKKMDTKSEEFYNLYVMISEKYWTFDPEVLKNDHALRCRWILHQMANRGSCKESDALAAVTVEVANLVVSVTSGSNSASHGAIEYDGLQVFFDVYKDKTALASMAKQLRNTIMVKLKEEKEKNGEEE